MARETTSDPAARAISRLAVACLASAQDFWSRAGEIGFRHLRQALAVGADPALAADLPDLLYRGVRHYLTEMALVPGLALERLGTELGRDGDGAEGSPGTCVVAGRPLMLPVRVRDAAQGMALYPVSARAAQRVLDGMGVSLRVADLGRDRTPLAIFALRNRQGDLGTPDELGAAFFVAPAGDWSAAGMYIADFPGSQAFSCAAGVEIWGYAKRQAPLEFTWTETEAACSLRREPGQARVLTITFPRGGTGASSRIPFTTYTMRGGVPHRTVLVRSGSGERIRAGGDGVRLALGAGKDCADDPLWRMLQALGVAEIRPMLHAWTEHVSIDFGPPVAV